MATTSLSLLQPSLFPPSSAAAASSSSSSSFFGWTHLRAHQNFISLSCSSSSSFYGKFNTRVSAGRFRTVVNASGDYYATLGVPKSANSKEIKAAYRKLARQVLNFTWVFF